MFIYVNYYKASNEISTIKYVDHPLEKNLVYAEEAYKTIFKTK